jgi:hypothetical protein
MSISRRSFGFTRDFACGLIRPRLITPAQRLNFDASSVPVPLRKAQGQGPSDLLQYDRVIGDLLAALKGPLFHRIPLQGVWREERQPNPRHPALRRVSSFFVQRRCEREAR